MKTSSSGYYVNDLPGITVNLLNYVSAEANASDYLTSVHNSEILRLIDTFIGRQKSKLNTKELLQHNELIQTYNDLEHAISRNSRFVGYAITPRESNTITSKILQVGFQSAPQSFTLYLFDTSQKTAIQTKAITVTKTDSLEWTDLDWDVSFWRQSGGAGQKYLIGYFEEDLSEDLYEMDWSAQHTHIAQRIFGHYMGVSPIRIRSTDLDGTNRPVLQNLSAAYNCKTPGFNLRFNTKCDITEVLKENISMFADALTYKIAVRILTDALAYTELNNVSNASLHRDTWANLITEYNGILNGGITAAGIPVKGLIDHLTMDFSTMDAVCLKERDNQIQGLKWR